MLDLYGIVFPVEFTILSQIITKDSTNRLIKINFVCLLTMLAFRKILGNKNIYGAQK